MSTPNDIHTLQEIMEQLTHTNPNISDLCDKVYHHNKSLGLTYVAIRNQLKTVKKEALPHAIKNFHLVIKELKSPNLFIHIEDEEAV
jgi:hypothetical protein